MKTTHWYSCGFQGFSSKLNTCNNSQEHSHVVCMFRAVSSCHLSGHTRPKRGWGSTRLDIHLNTEQEERAQAQYLVPYRLLFTERGREWERERESRRGRAREILARSKEGGKLNNVDWSLAVLQCYANVAIFSLLLSLSICLSLCLAYISHSPALPCHHVLCMLRRLWKWTWYADLIPFFFFFLFLYSVLPILAVHCDGTLAVRTLGP